MQITKPKRQRKMLFQAPDHIRRKHFAARLSPELRGSHDVKTIPIRRGDAVRIMRGDHKGFEGKITRVDRKKYRIYVEGLRREKVDGTTIFVPIHPSKVMITNLNLEDKWRKQILERKKEAYKIKEKTPAKIHSEVDETKELEEKKTIARKQKRRKKTAEKKPKEPKKMKKKRITETKKEEKLKAKRTRVRRKVTKKTKGGT